MAISITDDLLVNLETHQRTALVNAVTSLVNARIFGSSVLTKADELSGWNEGPPQGIATWLRLAESRVRNAAAHFNKEKLATLALVNDCDERDREALVETMKRLRAPSKRRPPGTRSSKHRDSVFGVHTPSTQRRPQPTGMATFRAPTSL